MPVLHPRHRRRGLVTGALDAVAPAGECGHVVLAGGGPLTAAGMVLRCTLGAGHAPARDHADVALSYTTVRWRCSPACSGLESHYLAAESPGPSGELLP